MCEYKSCLCVGCHKKSVLQAGDVCEDFYPSAVPCDPIPGVEYPSVTYTCPRCESAGDREDEANVVANRIRREAREEKRKKEEAKKEKKEEKGEKKKARKESELRRKVTAKVEEGKAYKCGVM